jgi:uncharacterized membrane protein YhdT
MNWLREQQKNVIFGNLPAMFILACLVLTLVFSALTAG